MKSGLCGLICITLLGCTSKPQAAPPAVESGKRQAAKVYFHGEGTDRDVKRFPKFLDIALDDYGMTRTDSSKDADATVKMRFSQEDKTQNVYSPVVWITMASRDHQQYIFKSCNSVSTGTSIFDEPIKYIVPFKLPADWKPHNGRMAVYVNGAEVKGLQDLVPNVKQRLADDGYRIAQERGDADAELQSIKLQKLAVPMHIVVANRGFELLDRNSEKFDSSDEYGDHTYVGVEPGINLENLPCRQSLETFGNRPDGSWDTAHTIAQKIREHLDQTLHSN